MSKLEDITIETTERKKKKQNTQNGVTEIK